MVRAMGLQNRSPSVLGMISAKTMTMNVSTAENAPIHCEPNTPAASAPTTIEPTMLETLLTITIVMMGRAMLSLMDFRDDAPRMPCATLDSTWP